MKTKAVRLYGVNDLRLEEFDLPEMQDDEILAKVVTNSICMSSHKAAAQGAAHKRVHDDVAENPVIVGHEFCGEILKVGSRWADKFSEGDKFSIQPALNYKGSLDAPGYSFPYIGGNAAYILIPKEVMEMDCLLPYNGDAFFKGSLSEPVSCIVGTYHAMYHIKQGTYIHDMGIREHGAMAIMAGAGPMGLEAIDYAVHNDRKPALLIVTDIDQARLDRAEQLLPGEEAEKNGVDLRYINTSSYEDPEAYMMSLTDDNGFDDILVMAPVRPLVEQADRLLAKDGCLNFFAGPSRSDFSAELNFYNVHYMGHHLVGTSGGNTDDLRESLEMMEKGLLNPAGMITHIGGINSAAQTIIDLPDIPGGKKLIYTHIDLPLTAIADFAEAGKENPLFAELDAIVKRNNNLWCAEAEQYLLQHA